MIGRTTTLTRIAAVAMAAACGTAAAQSSADPAVMMSPNGQAVMVDPFAAQMLMGTGVPLTRGQTGMLAASTMGRMTGIGSGRASGVRGANQIRGNLNVRDLDEKRPTLRLPAGQASNYFNRYGRSTSVDVSSPASRATTGKYYNRPGRFFPEGVR